VNKVGAPDEDRRVELAGEAGGRATTLELRPTSERPLLPCMGSTISHSAAEARRKMAHQRAVGDRGAVVSFSPVDNINPNMLKLRQELRWEETSE
jgi:hypothetical protein